MTREAGIDPVRDLFVDIGTGREAEIQDDLDELDEDSWVARALSAIVRASSHQLSRNPGLAADDWAKAKEAFEEAEAEDPVFSRPLRAYAEQATGMRQVALGMEQQLRFDFTGAAAPLQRGVMILEELRDETLPRLIDAEDDDDASAVLQQIRRVLPILIAELGAVSNAAAYQAATARGDYAEAWRQAKQYCDGLTESLDTPAGVLTGQQRRLLEMEAASGRANLAIAEARARRAEQWWGEALAAYERARDELRRAGRSALRSALPNAQMYQETFMAQAVNVIEPAVRDCVDEQRLRMELIEIRQELDELRNAVVARLEGRAHVEIVNENNAQLDATLTATQSQIQHTEHSVRADLAELAAALGSSGLPPRERDVLCTEATQLAEDKSQKGQSFLDRAAKFTEKVAGIVKNSEDAAGTVVPGSQVPREVTPGSAASVKLFGDRESRQPGLIKRSAAIQCSH